MALCTQLPGFKTCSKLLTADLAVLWIDFHVLARLDFTLFQALVVADLMLFQPVVTLDFRLLTADLAVL